MPGTPDKIRNSKTKKQIAMKKTKTILILSIVSIVFFGFSLLDDIPEGWFKAGSKPESYKMGIDNTVFKSGQKSVYIESIEDKIAGFGNLMQTCSAKDYLGERIKMTGYIKTENAEWAVMWLRVDSEDYKELGFDNMNDRPIKGTEDWTKCEIVLDVPEESYTLNFGVFLSSTGKLWFDDVTFEVVDKETPLTSTTPTVELQKPTNLDFEE